jgi:hypothetical protein
MSRIVFTPRKRSIGLNNLVESLRISGANVLKTKVVGSTYRKRVGDILINWGNSNPALDYDINTTASIEVCSNKIKTFNKLSEAGLSLFVPDFFIDKHEAIRNNRYPIYCRTLVCSSEGRGTVVAYSEEEVVDAPLYTIGVECLREVRLHIFKGSLISAQQKKRISSVRMTAEGFQGINDAIRNSAGGWIFARQGVVIPESVKNVAIRAANAVGVDMCAIDILCTLGNPCILDINTAPGITGTTVEHYRDSILNFQLTGRVENV